MFPVRNCGGVARGGKDVAGLIKVKCCLLIRARRDVFVFSVDTTLGAESRGIRLCRPSTFRISCGRIFADSGNCNKLRSSLTCVIKRFNCVFCGSSFRGLCRFSSNRLGVVSRSVGL